MRAYFRTAAAFCLVLAAVLLSRGTVFGWGSTGHKIINANAILCLPAELRPFYERHKDTIVEESVSPDVWKKNDPDERYKHFINLDKFEPYPFSSFPMSRKAALKRFGRVRLEAGGTLPWTAEEYFAQLIEAFKSRKAGKIAEVSGWLGHYVADGFQPLHVTRRFDGEKKANSGIHFRYEEEMVYKHRRELGAPSDYEAVPVSDVPALLFSHYREGFQEVPGISKADSAAKKAAKSYNDAYYARLYQLTGAMTRDRIEKASRTLAGLWLTAWIEAGRPELPQD